MTEPSRLAALVDGAPLEPEAARALWTEFSVHMDENKGDMAGFAKKKGWQSVVPEYRQGKAVLIARTGAAPQARAPAPNKHAGPAPARAPKKQAGPPGGTAAKGKPAAAPKKKGPPPPKKGPPQKRG